MSSIVEEIKGGVHVISTKTVQETIVIEALARDPHIQYALEKLKYTS